MLHATAASAGLAGGSRSAAAAPCAAASASPAAVAAQIPSHIWTTPNKPHQSDGNANRRSGATAAAAATAKAIQHASVSRPNGGGGSGCSHSAAAATHAQAASSAPVASVANSGPHSSLGSSAALALKRQIDAHPQSSLSTRKLRIRDVMQAPLWQTQANEATTAAVAAGSSTFCTATSAASSSSLFAPVSLSFGQPPLEIACARIMGTVAARIQHSDRTAAHFMLQDGGSSGDGGAPLQLQVSLPASLLFASMPLSAKLAAQQHRGGNTNHADATDALSPLLHSDAGTAATWLPVPSCVLDVSGTIELCRSTNTRRLLATSYQLLRPRAACDGKSTAELQIALQQREAEITALYSEHLFRPAIAPHPQSQQHQQPPQPPSVHLPLRASLSSPHGVRTPPSPARPIGSHASATAKSPSSPFSSSVASSSEHKRTGMSAALMQLQRRPAVSKLAFPAALPLPLPLPLPAPQQPFSGSYLDEFQSSSQEDQAHLALADRYMAGQRQQHMQQPIIQPTPYAQIPMQQTPMAGFAARPQQPFAGATYAPMQSPMQQPFTPMQPMHQPMQSSPMQMRSNFGANAASFVTPPPNRSFVAPSFSGGIGAQVGAPKPFSHVAPAPAVAMAKRPAGPTAPPAAAAITPAAFNAPRPFVKPMAATGAASGSAPVSTAASALAARIAALTAAATAAPPPDDSDAEVGFASGLGAVVPSEAARKAAEAMRAKWDREENEKNPQTAAAAAVAFPPAAAAGSSAISAAGAARSLSPSHRSASPPAPVASDQPPPGFVPGFSSGRGRVLEVSAEARALAVQKALEWEEEAASKEGRTPNKAEAAAMAAAAFAAPTGAVAAAGGFSSSKPKPFKPPAQIRPIPARGAIAAVPAASSSSSSSAAAASTPAAPSVYDPVALRKSKLALLDQQLDDWESGTAPVEDDGLVTADGHPTHSSSSSAAAAAVPSFVSSSSSAAAAASVPRFDSYDDGHDDSLAFAAASGAPPGFVAGFSTGSGKPVAVSDAAQKRAREIMAEVEAAASADEAEEQQGSHRKAVQPRSSAAAAAASPASAGGFSSGGFGSAKPFKPPSSIRPRTTPAAAAAAASPAAAGASFSRPIVPAASAATAATSAPEHDAAAIRRAKMAALDKQLAALEAEAETGMDASSNEAASAAQAPVSFSAGFSSASKTSTVAGFQSGRGGFSHPQVAASPITAAAETSAQQRAKRVQAELMADLGMSEDDMSTSFADEDGAGMNAFSTAKKSGFSPASPAFGSAASFGAASSVGFGSAASSFSRASSTQAFEPAAALDDASVHSSRAAATVQRDFTSPLAGRKRILSQIDEEEPGDAATHTQQQVQRTTSPPDTISTGAAPLTNVATPLWSPPQSVTTAAPVVTASDLQFTSPPSSLSSCGSSSFSQAPINSNVIAQSTNASQQNKRQRTDEGNSVGAAAVAPPHSPPASALATVAAATPVAAQSVAHVAPTPIPIAPFSPMSPPRPSGAVGADTSTVSPPSRESGGKHVSPPGSASQIYIPATPSLEMDTDISGSGGLSDISASLEKQFDLVADDDAPHKQSMHEEQGETLDQQLLRVKQPEKNGGAPLSPTAQLAPPAVLPYLPPALSSLSPAAGSPASLRLRAAARVATFGAAAPPPSCSTDHVLFCLREQSNGGHSVVASPAASSHASCAPSSAGSSFSSPAASLSSTRASLWTRACALLESEFAEGEPDASHWSEEKRAIHGKLEQRWKQEFEQVRCAARLLCITALHHSAWSLLLSCSSMLLSCCL